MHRRTPFAAVVVATLALLAGACSGSPSGQGTTTSASASPGGLTTLPTSPSNSATTSATALRSTTTTVASRPPCTLAVTKDVYDGFQVGVPAGWYVATLNGMIVVSNGTNGTEEAVVRPGLVTGGLTPGSLFSDSLATLKALVSASGGTLSATVTSTGGLPAASLQLQAGGVSMRGEASIEVLSDPTAHASSVAAFSAYWAPTAQFAAAAATLAGVGACYAPERGTLFRVAQDQVFTYAIPLGWTPQNEGQDTIQIADGNNASASYLLTLATPSEGVDSDTTLLSWFLSELGIHVTKVLNTVNQASQTTVTGALGQGMYQEFLATLPDGRPAHALVSVQSTTGGGNTSGVIRMGIAVTSLWNSVNGALIQIMGSIQHNFTQDLEQWEHLSQQWQAFGQQVQGFDDTLNGVDLVHDPETGQNFEAPYDTYDNSGDAGPGYYDPAGNKLQIITP